MHGAVFVESQLHGSGRQADGEGAAGETGLVEREAERRQRLNAYRAAEARRVDLTVELERMLYAMDRDRDSVQRRVETERPAP